MTQVLPAKTTSSGRHGYYYVQMPNGYNIEIVSNLDVMGITNWPIVSVGQYSYVQGRMYYDNASSQGIDWTHRGATTGLPNGGYDVICDANGVSNCTLYH